MNEIYKIEFDNTPMNDLPIKLDEAKIHVKRDLELKGLFVTFTSELTFWGDCYDYLNSVYENSGYCTDVNVKLYKRCNDYNEGWESLFEGIIKIRDVKFNLSLCQCSATIEDNTFYGKINSNKQIKSYLTSIKSKNGITIASCGTVALNYFKPSDSSILNAIYVYDIIDCFEFLLRFMTDGQTITVASDWYASENAANRYYAISSAKEARTASNLNITQTSFYELFNELRSRFDLGFGFYKDENGNVTMRLETQDWFYASGTALSLNMVKNLEREIDDSKLFAYLKAGDSNYTSYEDTKSDLPRINLLGFTPEEYPIQGTCNTDSVLDLTTKNFIIDHNTIEKIVETDNTNEQYDEKMILLQYYPSSPNALPASWALEGFTYAYYNPNLTNQFAIQNFKLAGAVAKYNNSEAQTIDVNTTAYNEYNLTGLGDANEEQFTPFPFTNEVSDPGNNWNNTLYKYTANANGAYVFEQQFNINLIDFIYRFGPHDFVQYAIYFGFVLDVFNSSNTLINTIIPRGYLSEEDNFIYKINKKRDFSQSYGTDYIDIVNFIGSVKYKYNLELNSGDYIKSRIVINKRRFDIDSYAVKTEDTDGSATFTSKVRILQSSYLKTLFTESGSGVFVEGQPSSIKNSIFKFDSVLSNEQKNDMLNNITGQVEFNYKQNGGNLSSWINSAEYNIKDGLTKFETATNQ